MPVILGYSVRSFEAKYGKPTPPARDSCLFLGGWEGMSHRGSRGVADLEKAGFDVSIRAQEATPSIKGYPGSGYCAILPYEGGSGEAKIVQASQAVKPNYPKLANGNMNLPYDLQGHRRPPRCPAPL